LRHKEFKEFPDEFLSANVFFKSEILKLAYPTSSLNYKKAKLRKKNLY
jgi:hypothetical protein